MADSKGVMILAEVAGGKMAAIGAELLGAGRKLADDLGEELSALLIGSEVGGLAQEAIAAGADKVYVADEQLAIITSANLSAGGLFRNYEYGIELSDSTLVTRIRQDVLEYADLGAFVGRQELEAYCSAVDKLRAVFQRQRSSVSAKLNKQFEESLRTVEDDLIRLRLGGGAVHTVFAKTIQYLLRRDGPMSTPTLHALIASIHPDLCDDKVDRIIDGKSFGKKWKHAVRTAQQQLKNKGIIERDGSVWKTT